MYEKEDTFVVLKQDSAIFYNKTDILQMSEGEKQTRKILKNSSINHMKWIFWKIFLLMIIFGIKKRIENQINPPFMFPLINGFVIFISKSIPNSVEIPRKGNWQ